MGRGMQTPSTSVGAILMTTIITDMVYSFQASFYPAQGRLAEI